MRTSSSLCFLAIVTIGVPTLSACGSSENGSTPEDAGPSSAAPSPTSCSRAQDCNPDQCLCTDGEAFLSATVCAQGSCSTGGSDTFCATMCKSHGGVSAVRPQPNVAASAECDAWCAKGAGLACGSTACDRFFFCSVGKRSCEAAERAALKCAVEKGTWACSQQSDSWRVSSSCGTFAELCTAGDAGTD